jgi:hypothetical protein
VYLNDLKYCVTFKYFNIRRINVHRVKSLATQFLIFTVDLAELWWRILTTFWFYSWIMLKSLTFHRNWCVFKNCKEKMIFRLYSHHHQSQHYPILKLKKEKTTNSVEKKNYTNGIFLNNSHVYSIYNSNSVQESVWTRNKIVFLFQNTHTNLFFLTFFKRETIELSCI